MKQGSKGRGFEREYVNARMTCYKTLLSFFTSSAVGGNGGAPLLGLQTGVTPFANTLKEKEAL